MGETNLTMFKCDAGYPSCINRLLLSNSQFEDQNATLMKMGWQRGQDAGGEKVIRCPIHKGKNNG